MTFDCSGLRYMDSSGLRILAELSSHAGSRGGSITLASASPIIVRLLEATDLTGAGVSRSPVCCWVCGTGTTRRCPVAVVRETIERAPWAVFAALVDPLTYQRWLAGCKAISDIGSS